MTTPRSTPRRSRWPVLALAGLLALGALAGATAYTSTQTAQTQQDLARTLQAQIEATGYAHITSSTYQRGLLGSTQTLGVTVGKGEGAEALIVVNHIQHGPFPGFRAVGNAVIDTEVRFADRALQAKVEQALGGRPPVIHTVVGLSGATSTHLEVPAGRFSEDGAVLSWQALKGDVVNTGLSSTARLNWPELMFSSDGDTLTVSGLSLVGSSRKQGADDPLGVGQQTVSVKAVTFSGTSDGAPARLRLGDLQVGSESALSGGFYSGSVRYGVGQFSASLADSGEQMLSDLQLQLSLNHLSRAPLARMVKTLGSLGEQARAGADVSGLSAAQEKALTADALAVLNGQPVFSLDRLSFKLPGGEMMLSGQLDLPGAASLTPETAQLLADTPEAALGMLRAKAHFEAPEAALRGLLESVEPGAARSLGQMIEAGYLKRQGGQLTSDLAFGDGRATINGQPLGGF
ncbi:hypothetical protein DKM44_13915 [Deinococcus irradiatisoli]|uniref:DUF945 domain-containing protein n=1 Tax=Deinococcus irradiatisoli TaxID=2202254 RepID=A0A2Z3JKW7_9DEIO|nr:YdgA family protein [Deinococcus irradiatisoli]AWN24191.1 hypothetical protein DKM44_13915 [Deinococcus irradiatisoli]